MVLTWCGSVNVRLLDVIAFEVARSCELVWSGPTSGSVRHLTLPAGGGLVDKRYRNSFFCIPT